MGGTISHRAEFMIRSWHQRDAKPPPPPPTPTSRFTRHVPTRCCQPRRPARAKAGTSLRDLRSRSARCAGHTDRDRRRTGSRRQGHPQDEDSAARPERRRANAPPHDAQRDRRHRRDVPRPRAVTPQRSTNPVVKRTSEKLCFERKVFRRKRVLRKFEEVILRGSSGAPNKTRRSRTTCQAVTVVQKLWDKRSFVSSHKSRIIARFLGGTRQIDPSSVGAYRISDVPSGIETQFDSEGNAG